MVQGKAGYAKYDRDLQLIDIKVEGGNSRVLDHSRVAIVGRLVPKETKLPLSVSFPQAVTPGHMLLHHMVNRGRALQPRS